MEIAGLSFITGAALLVAVAVVLVHPLNGSKLNSVTTLYVHIYIALLPVQALGKKGPGIHCSCT